MKIEVGGCYLFITTRPTVAEVKAIHNNTIYYRVFDMDGRLINEHLVRPLALFESWSKSRAKRKNPTGK